MPITTPTLWTDGENALFQFLLTQTDSEDGKNAFLGKIPTHVYDGWSFSMSGGGVPLETNRDFDTPGNCGLWQFEDCKVEAVYIERADAQMLAGQIRVSLPLSDATSEAGLASVNLDAIPNGVKRFFINSAPSLEPDTIPDRKGGQVEVWRLTYGLTVILDQTTA